MVQLRKEVYETCFTFLEEEEAETLASLLETVSCDAGSLLYHDGQPADGLYFLVSGKIAVQKKTGFGDRVQVVALLDPGAPVGEGGLFSDITRGSSVTAVQDSVLYYLAKSDFKSLSENHKTLAVKLLSWLLGRVSIRLEKNSERLAHIL